MVDTLNSRLNDANSMIDDLKLQNQKLKAKFNGTDVLKDKMRERESEVDVLKEMIRGLQLQVKSKDTDIQRLNIKVKRLEKTTDPKINRNEANGSRTDVYS